MGKIKEKWKRAMPSIISSLALFLAGASLTINHYLAVLFLILGIFCVYYQNRNIIKITYGSEGSSPPKGSPGDLFLTYKDK